MDNDFIWVALLAGIIVGAFAGNYLKRRDTPRVKAAAIAGAAAAATYVLVALAAALF
jgi:hypothetical protein